MKRLFITIPTILFLVLLSLPLSAKKQWIVEAEKEGYVTWSKDSVADIHAPGGLTLWNTRRMTGNVVIEYEARIVSDGRVSDLNCFWMASDPKAKDVFVNAKERGGKFINSYALSLYYMGYGGNYNATTRFRCYRGDARGVTDAAYRPPILREYTDSGHMIKGDHWYAIRLEVIDGRVRYIIDGECLVDYADPTPLTEGFFGFRTTLAHAQLRNFRFRQWPALPDADKASLHIERKGKGLHEGISLYDINGNTNSALSATVTRTEGVTFGLPFSQGELPAGEALTLKHGSKVIPTDQWTLASWPDGSVKWKAVACAYNKGNDYAITAAKPQLHTSENGMLFDSITVNNKRMTGRAWVECNGQMLPTRRIVKEQSGNVRDCWRMEGDNFTIRLYTYLGSNEVKIVHTFFIDSIVNAGGLQSLAVRFEVPMNGADHFRKVLFLTDSAKVRSMDVKPLIARRPIMLDANGVPTDERSRNILGQIASWDGFRLSQLSPNGFSIRKRATTLSPWIGTIEGHRAPGIVAVGDRQKGVAFHLTDFWQSYPSTLQVDNARSSNATVSLYLWSKEAEAMSFHHYDTIPHGLEASYEDVQKGMSTANGIARTSVIYLTLSESGIDSMQTMLPSLAQHAQLLPTPQYLHRKRAFGIWSLDRATALDSTLYNIIRFYSREQERNAWYGFFNYGDVMHTYDSSRDEWRYDVGGYAWDNTELASPAMFWYEFLRTGSADAWRMAVAMCRHNAEVDCYHRGPHAGLGTRHNVLHWGCGAKEARISQAFWNRFLYYLTADERTGDIMTEVKDADQLLYSLDPMRLAQPRSAKFPCTAPARLRIGPDWMAYAANWFTEWERTGNSLYRDKILAGMRSIAALPHGLFSGPKALGYDPATGVITWEGDTAVQNTNHLLTIMGGFEMMNEMMLSLSTPEWNKAWLSHAAEYKEKALKISNNHFRIPRLKAYAYWLTGNNAYWQAALKDLKISDKIIYTNDAATFSLDAIFMQEVMPFNHH